MQSCRFILDQPHSGATNMALDEALLESAAETRGRGSDPAEATLRIYQWAQPTLSLGYFQAASDREGHAASHVCQLIRRPSGGGAILHDRELTYALVLPAAIATMRPAPQWYLDVHNALIAAILELTGREATLCEDPPQRSARDEPFLCFQRRATGDVLIAGDQGEHKVAGSAQRRRRGAILQHGSVLLEKSPHAPELPGIADIAEVALDFTALSASFRQQLSNVLNCQWHSSSPTAYEQATADRLRTSKYGSTAWTLRR